jgi:hypothetical protein
MTKNFSGKWKEVMDPLWNREIRNAMVAILTLYVRRRKWPITHIGIWGYGAMDQSFS